MLDQCFAVGKLFVLRSVHRSDGEIQTVQDRRCYQAMREMLSDQAHRTIAAV